MPTSLEQYRATMRISDQAFDVVVAVDSLTTDLFNALSDEDRATLEAEDQKMLAALKRGDYDAH